MKKIVAVLLALVLSLSLVAFAESDAAQSYTIGVLMKTLSASYWQSMAAGLQAEVDQMDGVEIEIFGAESEDDLTGQLNLMENMINGGKYDALCVAPITPTNLISGVVKANEAGIPVVMFNTITELEGVDVYAYSGYNQYNGGGKIADWVNEQTGGVAKVAIIEGLPSDYTTQRMGGFVDRCAEAYPEIELVASQPGDWVRETGMNAAMDMLQAHPEITVIYGLSDEMALGAVQACKQLGREDIIVVGLDGNPNAFESVKAGELTATLDCGPVAIGANAILAITEALDGVERTEKVIEAETTVVDITLVDDYIK